MFITINDTNKSLGVEINDHYSIETITKQITILRKKREPRFQDPSKTDMGIMNGHRLNRLNIQVCRVGEP